MEWFPSRMMEGRALELEARFEMARVRGSTNTSATSTVSPPGVRGWERKVVGDSPGGPGLNRLRAFSAPSKESSSSDSLSSEVSRSSIALWIVVCIRSKKSVGDAGAGAEWMAGRSIPHGIVKDSGPPSPLRAASGAEGDDEVDAEEYEKLMDAFCTALSSDAAGESGRGRLRLFDDRELVVDVDGR